MEARLWKDSAGCRRVRRRAPVAALSFLLATIPAGAQYISPGSVAATSQIPTRDSMKTNVDAARWRLGAIRLSPWIGLTDAALVSIQNVGETSPQEDFTATAGAGLRAYLPVGKVVWAAHALPEYVWWQDDASKRRFNGRYGLGLFGYFNHLTVELSGRRDEQQDFFSDEIRELTSSRNDVSTLRLELQPKQRILIYGAARRSEFSNQETEAPTLALLDRDEESYSLGVRYRSPVGWTVGIGLEDTSIDFDPRARNLSNSGTTGRLETRFDGARVDFRLLLGFRDLKGEEGSEFGRFDETTGNFEVLVEASPRLTSLGYARRQQTFSIDERNAYVLTQRQGVRLDYSISKASFGLRFEVGDDEYAAISTGAFDRRDDVTTYGIDLWFDLTDLFGLSAHFLRTEYDSSLAGFDRDVTSFNLAFQLGDAVQKLSLGRPDADW